MRANKTLAAGMATALAVGTLAALSTAGTAQAASTSTAKIHGAPMMPVGVVWYDSGTIGGSNPGPSRTASLTAKQDGNDLAFTLKLTAGPQNNAAAGATAKEYRLDAFVRLNGAAHTRGTRFAGPVGTVDVPASGRTYASGATITGRFKNVPKGTHTLTLTDLLLDNAGDSSGGGFGKPTGFDTYYNAGTTAATIVNRPTDWPLKQSVTIGAFVDTTAPVLKVKAPKAKAAKLKAIKGTIRDGASGPKSVTIQAIEKRGKKWYAYKGGKKWAKKSSKAKAFKAAKKLTDRSVSSGAWSIKVKKAKKGTLYVKYSGIDKSGNKSKVKTYKKKLT